MQNYKRKIVDVIITRVLVREICPFFLTKHVSLYADIALMPKIDLSIIADLGNNQSCSCSYGTVSCKKCMQDAAVEIDRLSCSY
jgi:hypothetical protein